jgi:hypothetical protein
MQGAASVLLEIVLARGRDASTAPQARTCALAIDQASKGGPRIVTAWTQEDRRVIGLALFGVEHELAIERGSESLGHRRYDACAFAAEYIRDHLKRAILRGIADDAAAQERTAYRELRHVRFLRSKRGRRIYTGRAKAVANSKRSASGARKRLEYLVDLSSRVKAAPLRSLPVDLVAIHDKATLARLMEEQSRADYAAAWSESFAFERDLSPKALKRLKGMFPGAYQKD